MNFLFLLIINIINMQWGHKLYEKRNGESGDVENIERILCNMTQMGECGTKSGRDWNKK